MRICVLGFLLLLCGVGFAADGQSTASTSNQAFRLGVRAFGYPSAKNQDELRQLLLRDWMEKPHAEAKIFIRRVYNRRAPLQAWISSGYPDRDWISLIYISALLGVPAGTLTVTFTYDKAALVSGVSCALSEQ